MGAGKALTGAGWAADERGRLAWVHAKDERPNRVHLWEEPGQQPWGLFVLTALRAHRVYLDGRDYLVEGHEVRIVDVGTGRLTNSRWSNHVHQVA